MKGNAVAIKYAHEYAKILNTWIKCVTTWSKWNSLIAESYYMKGYVIPIHAIKYNTQTKFRGKLYITINTSNSVQN